MHRVGFFPALAAGASITVQGVKGIIGVGSAIGGAATVVSSVNKVSKETFSVSKSEAGPTKQMAAKRVFSVAKLSEHLIGFATTLVDIAHTFAAMAKAAGATVVGLASVVKQLLHTSCILTIIKSVIELGRFCYKFIDAIIEYCKKKALGSELKCHIDRIVVYTFKVLYASLTIVASALTLAGGSAGSMGFGIVASFLAFLAPQYSRLTKGRLHAQSQNLFVAVVQHYLDKAGSSLGNLKKVADRVLGGIDGYIASY